MVEGRQTCGALEWFCIWLPLNITLSEEAPRKKWRKTIVIGNYDIPDDMPAHVGQGIHQILTVAPERRAFIEAIIQNPWVKGSKINIQREPYPDPKIMDNLIDQRPCPSTISGTSFNNWSNLEQSASEPTFGLSGQMMARRAPMPLWCSQKKIPTSSHAPLIKAVSAPCIGCRNDVPLPPGLSSSNNIGFQGTDKGNQGLPVETLQLPEVAESGCPEGPYASMVSPEEEPHFERWPTDRSYICLLCLQ
ncbi:hypothetical protein ACRRTK_024764 [Alexandromys fortis]